MPSTNNVIKFKQPSTVVKFTEKSVLKIPTSSKRKILIDEQTGLRIRQGATKNVYMLYKWFNGKPLKDDIGVVGQISLSEARKIYQARMSRLAVGVDYRNEHDSNVRYQKIRVLCKKVIETNSNAGKHTSTTTKLYTNLLENYLPPKILNSTFKDLEKDDYVNWYVGTDSKFNANNSTKLIGLAFNSQSHNQKQPLEHPHDMLRDVKIRTDKVTRKTQYINPEPESNELGEFITYAMYSVFGDFADTITAKDLEDKGHTVPKDFEPIDVWHYKPKPHYRVYFDALMFMLLTGIRDEKARTLKWEQVNFNEGYIDFSQRKRDEVQRCEFTNQLYWLLMWRYKNKPRKTCKYVFPSNNNWKQPITTARKVYEFVNEHAGLGQKQSAHTLRRTIGNVATWLGYGKEIQDGILHHAPQDVGTINYINRADQHRLALQKCHDYLDVRFAEGIILNNVETPYPFKETKEASTSVFGSIYGTRNMVEKDKDFHADAFDPRVRKKKFGGDFIED